MPTGNIRSASAPTTPIADRRATEDKKAVSVPDLRGSLVTPEGIYPLRLTEPEALPRPDAGAVSSPDSRKQLSDYHAELAPALPGVVTTGAAEQTSPDLHEQANTPTQPLAGELPEPTPAAMPGPGKKKAEQMQTQGGQPVSAKAVSKGASPQVSSELIAEVKRLVTEATPEQLKAAGGNLTKLVGFDESTLKTALTSNTRLLKAFRAEYNSLIKGSKGLPADFSNQLIAGFKTRAEELANPQQTQRTASAKQSQAAGKVKKVDKLTLDRMPGLRDMFLARAVNHLITGELHNLDPMVGDEGCQLRTPFTLDMYELVQDQLKKSPFQSSASHLVSEYRKATGEEQAAAIARMKELEQVRTSKGAEQDYEKAVSEFMASNALQASMAAKSGSYQEMFTYLMTAIEQSWPGATEYLEHLASETLFWGHQIDPFGLSMLTFKEPMFPDSILARRKVAQAEYSKRYFVKALSDLLQAKGIDVEAKNVVAGYSKNGEEERLVKVPTSNPESILSMLLYSIQLCTATIPAKNKELPLIQCWESIRSLVPMMLAKERPIIVNLKRVVATGPEDEPEFTSDFSESLFYEPTEDGYKYQPDPSPAQQERGGVVVSGFAMLRPGDEKLTEGGLKVSPWVHEEDPKMFKEGFTSVDFSKLFFLGGIKHPPLNVGAAGARALALSPEEVEGSKNRTKTRDFGQNSENSFPYAEALHTKVLENLGQAGMTEAGQRWLTPDYQLTDEAKHLVFPDQCPVDITGSRPEAKMNITEEFQLLLRLAEAANLESVRYSMEYKEFPGEVSRVANKTIPFSIKHICASTFKHENAISERQAEASQGVKAYKQQKISDLVRRGH